MINKTEKIIYFDNASTSHPKPLCVINSMYKYFVETGSSPGRSGHTLSRKADILLDETRSLMCQIFGIDTKYKNHIIFTYNATYALNMVIKGYLKKDDHAIISSFEHNSVIRPIQSLADKKIISFDVWNSDKDGLFEIKNLELLIKKNTKIIILSHASNVLGILSPIEKLIEFAHSKNIKVLIDATQVAGIIPLEYGKLNVDFACFTGHKGLMGPSGIGGFFVKNPDCLDTIIEGGSGTNSHSFYQPIQMPEKFESGTINYLGIAGLNQSLKFLISESVQKIYLKEGKLTEYFINKLKLIKEVSILGSQNLETKIPIISFKIKNLQPNELSQILDNTYNIMTRCGLHCASLAHKAVETYPNGAVRVSFGYFTTFDEINYFLSSLNKIINLYV